MNLQHPEILVELINSIPQQEEHPEDDFILESAPKASRRSKKANSAAVSTLIFKPLSSSNTQFLNMGLETSAILAKDRATKKLSIAQMLNGISTPHGELSVLWRAFRDKILESKHLKKVQIT